MEEGIEIRGPRMIRGSSEAQYRALEDDSSSSIKVFLEDKLKYYKKYVSKQWTDEPDTLAVIIGKLVDCLILGTREELNERFHQSTVTNIPTGLMLQFVEALYKIARRAANEEGIIEREMPDMMLEAYNNVKFDKDGVMVAFKKQSFEKTVEVFHSSEAYTYYSEIISVRPNNKTVINASIMEAAERVVEQLMRSAHTSRLFDTPEEGIEIINQLKIDGFKIDGFPLKGMLDRVVIDHNKFSIQFYDLKCTWNVEDFYEKYYLYRKSYLQAYIYYKALESRAFDMGFDYSSYKILLPRFIVADSSSFYEPLIYTLSEGDLRDAYNGFIHKNRNYIGLKDAIQQLKWAKDNNIWNLSFENAVLGGVVPISRSRV